MGDFNWTQFWVVAVIVAIVFGLIGAYGFPRTKIEVDQDAIDLAVGNATAELYVEIEDLKSIIANYTEVEEEELPIEELGYVIDGVFLEIPFNETLSDRELNLFDGEVEFDGKDYDAEEVFTFNGLELLANEHDFKGNVYMTVPEGAIEYRINFDSDLNTNLIDEDETLVFNFLGQEYEVSDWNGDEVTFTGGTEYFLSEGESVLDGSVILEVVLSESVYITVNGEGKKIKEGETDRFGDLEVYVKEVMYSGYAFMVIIINSS